MKIIPTKVTRSVGRQILLAKKNSPKLFFAAGVTGVVGGTVLACRATLHLDEALEDVKKDVYLVKEHMKLDDPDHQMEEVDYQKTIAAVYIRGAYRIGKLYAPAIIVGGLGIASLTGSHVILTRRNAAVGAAYAAMATAFEQYRERIKEEVGVDKELELYRGIEWQEVEGSEGKMLEPVTDPGKWSPYVRFFDETNPRYQPSPDLNRFFIDCQERYANHLLQARGHVFLNEVYDSLGIERSSAGQVVGWLLDGDGDGYIDFGVYEAVNAEFLIRAEKTVVLDFNVDGIIYDLIEESKNE
jgi:hypothetical protein